MKLLTLLGICLLFAVALTGQEDIVLEGTIGKYPVVLLVQRKGSTYFYKKYRRDIRFDSIRMNGNSLLLQKISVDEKTQQHIVRENLVLQKDASGKKWTGTWKGQGQALPVLLRPLDTLSAAFRHVAYTNYTGVEDKTGQIFARARLSGMAFVRDSVSVYGKARIEWAHEPMTGILSVSVLSGLPEGTRIKVNQAIRKKIEEQLHDAFTCTLQDGEKPGEWEFWISDLYLSAEFLSVHARVNGYCGGAYPLTEDGSFTIALKTGELVEDIDELAWFTGSKPPAKGSIQYERYLTNRTNAIVALLKNLYPREMMKPHSEEACDYSEPWPWTYPVWYLTEKGLYISTSFPHGMNSCNQPEFSYIPYGILQRYRPKN